MTRVRIGLLGAGSHSTNNHGPSLRDYAARHPDAVDLVAVCDLDADKGADYAERFGFARACTDLEALLADGGLDGLVAVTPIDATEALGVRILEAGVPVVIEKPPGVGLAGAEALYAAAVRTGTGHMVSFNRRFNPALVRAVDWLDRQDRPLRHVVSRMLRRGRLEPEFARDTGLHQVDAVLSLLAQPSRFVGHREWPQGARAALYTGRIETATEASASLVQTPDVGVSEETMELLGDGFRIVVDVGEGAGGVTIDADGERVLTWMAQADGLAAHERNGSYGETAAFIEALAAGRPLTPTLADALVTMRAAVALQEGRTVDDLTAGIS